MSTTPSWTELGNLVDAGHLTLEPGVAERCAARCAQLRANLVDMRDRAKELATVDGLGQLPSGLALARKFELKASGGDYALDQALTDHITVIEQMQAVFERIAADYTAAEHANTQSLGALDPSRGPADR